MQRVRYFVSLNSAGKAFKVAADYEAGVEYVPLTEEEKN